MFPQIATETIDQEATTFFEKIFLTKNMLRQKRKLEQETTTNTTTDIANGSAQWWYNRMSKQRRMRMHPDLNAHLTYNPAKARIELSIIVPKVSASYTA